MTLTQEGYKIIGASGNKVGVVGIPAFAVEII
jgi:hypothetical protein